MAIKAKQELRRVKRISAKVPVTIKKKQNGAVEELTGQTRDLSVRGVFMYLSNRVAEGSELELIFPMPQSGSPAEDSWVRCRARVLRVEKTNGGQRFGVAAVLESYERLEDTVTAKA
ncbi:MAG TPA: PilZ domain-containing protein [Terriglobales bacterium]|nr:PilZ domain-containing protein [Terriglobales bacterium]